MKTFLTIAGVILGLLGLYFAYLGITSHPNYVKCSGDLDACATRAANALATAENKTPKIIIVTATELVRTVIVKATVEVAKEVTREITKVVTVTPRPTEISFPLCSNSDPPCMHIAESGQYWSRLADDYMNDFCRWPEIANLNRTEDGTYSGIRANGIYFIPDIPQNYRASTISSEGAIQEIPVCLFDQATRSLANTLPCEYEIPAENPIYGIDYRPLSLLFFGVSTHGPYIADHNLLSGCSIYGYSGQPPQRIVLEPSAKVIIPRRPSE